MSELFLELFSEEMPASLIKNSAENIFRIISNGLNKNNIVFQKSILFYTPKRIVLSFQNGERITKKRVHPGKSFFSFQFSKSPEEQ